MATVTAEPIAAVVTTTVEADLPTGIDTTPPSIAAEVTTTVDVDWPESSATEWTARLVDKDGTVSAELPGVELSPVSLTLSDTEQWSAKVPTGAAAVRVGLADPLPALEMMVLRGDRVVTWGPITDVGSTVDSALDLTCRGATYHLDRTLVGPAQLPNKLTNASFALGLYGWQQWRTSVIEVAGTDLAFPTFVAVDGLITTVSSGTGVPSPPRSGVRMCKFDGSTLGSNGGAQVAQDFTVTASAYRTVDVTARAAFFVPTGVPFARTNIDGAIYVSAHAAGANFPDDYFAPDHIAVAEWPEVPIQGRWHDLEATLSLPAGTDTWTIHVAFSPPRMTCYVALCEATVDDAIEGIDKQGPSLLQQLVEHAQDTTYGHVDRNISVTAYSGGPRVDRIYRHADHQNVGAAIRELVDQDLVDWRTSYTTTERRIVAGYTLPSKSSAAALWVTSTSANPGVAAVRFTSAWSRGSTVVTAQRSGTRAEAAATATGDTLAWEEVFVAPDHVPYWRLSDWATAKVTETSAPLLIDVEYDPGSVWVKGTVGPGAIIDATLDVHGVRLTGEWRAVMVTLDPNTDRAAVQFAPEGTITRTAL